MRLYGKVSICQPALSLRRSPSGVPDQNAELRDRLGGLIEFNFASNSQLCGARRCSILKALS